MITPTYAGLPIFGPAPMVSGRLNPVERWWTAYPGVHGRQSQAGGTRGASADAQFILTGVDYVDLDTAINVWETLKAGGAAWTLVDSKGITWPLMILIEFTPAGRVYEAAEGPAQEFVAHFESTV